MKEKMMFTYHVDIETKVNLRIHKEKERNKYVCFVLIKYQ
jgi:hypothetical protein